MRLSDVDNMLPAMRCDKGCGECCGVAPATPSEYDRVMEYARRNKIEPQRNGATCPWYQGGTCAVYPVRPVVCRLMGHTPSLMCSRGYNVNISQRAEFHILKQTMGQFVFRGHDMRLLHEAVYTLDEMAGIVQEGINNIQPVTINGIACRRLDDKTYHLGRAVQERGEAFGTKHLKTMFLDVSEAPPGMDTRPPERR